MMTTLVERIRRLPFAIPFVLALLVFGLLYVAGWVRFEENDDVVMALIASGKYTGRVDPHLVFSNVLYGYQTGAGSPVSGTLLDPSGLYLDPIYGCLCIPLEGAFR